MLYIFEIFLPKSEIKILYNYNSFLFVHIFIFAITCCSDSLCLLFLIIAISFYSSLVRHVKSSEFSKLPAHQTGGVNKRACLWYPHRAMTLYSISGAHRGLAVCHGPIWERSTAHLAPAVGTSTLVPLAVEVRQAPQYQEDIVSVFARRRKKLELINFAWWGDEFYNVSCIINI